MCGICGIVTKGDESPDITLLLGMMTRLTHRGPDSSGYFRDKTTALGHTRLSIIDLSGGAQPLSNEDGSIWITFNGEIFNYVELAEELKKNGHIFSTKSDTEVIVHAYEEWGTSCFTRFNGQWALALWDRCKKTLILSRDRLGIRPLYYTKTGKKFMFSSEIKALGADTDVSFSFDPAGLHEVFTFWCPVAPRTVFKGIFELKPGHFAIYRNDTFKEIPYWQITFPEKGNENGKSEAENITLLKEILINATQLRFTRSDVPVGAYLSGGLDSSITAAIIAHFTETPLKTFSIRFKNAELDEGMYQNEMVKRLGAEHEDIAVSVKDIGDIFPMVIWHAERPILRTAPAPLFLLSRLVRNAGYKVVVTGEGADEVVAGYDIYREAKVREFIARDPLSSKRTGILFRLYPWMARSPKDAPAFAQLFFTKSLDLSDPGLSHRPRWNTTMMIKRLITTEFLQEMEKTDITGEFLCRLPGDHDRWDSLGRAQWLEMTTLLPGYILSAQGDRMLMANSVEGRFPFLDCDFVDFANNLPARHKLLALQEKHILKRAFIDYIPHDILQRPKQPYRAPDAASFFGGHCLEWFDDVMSESSIKRAGVFRHDAAAMLLSKCSNMNGINMSNTDNMRIVGLVSTMLIHHQYIEHGGGVYVKERPPEPMKKVDVIDGRE
jgi:asparagine synthase (glutamine-hydrolysing)